MVDEIAHQVLTALLIWMGRGRLLKPAALAVASL
jgi:hypothetical protein